MILTNVGLQIFNNWCSSRQNGLLQQKREDFEKAARERNTQRMWQLMREGQEITRQLEEEKHEQRLEELKNDIGGLLQRLAYSETISNWPLNVLPIVMKNQALGNLLANQEERIALHCIFTPSNSSDFNRLVFPRLDTALEEYINRYWGVMSEHPILFYSGAWKSNQTPTEVQIDSMRTALSNLPTLVVIPFFRPNDGKLVFHARIWGVGALSSDEFSIPEIEPTGFQRDYNSLDELNNEQELLDEMVEDFVPYLQCLIGYIADTFFWSSSALRPHLPRLISDGIINTDGMKYLVNDSREYYDRLLMASEENAKDNPFQQANLINLLEGSSELWDESSKEKKLEEVFVNYCNSKSHDKFTSFDEALSGFVFGKVDLSFLESYLKLCLNSTHVDIINKKIESINETIVEEEDINLLSEKDVSKLYSLAQNQNAIACYRLGELYEYSIGVDYNPDEYIKYYDLSRDLGLTLASIRDKIFNHDGVGITSAEYQYLLKNETAQFIIFRSYCLYKGYGVDQSIQHAMDELEKLSDSNHPYAYYLAAKIVKDHYGEEQGELIIELLLKSANLGYVEAQVDLMNIYYDGHYVPENPSLCVEFAQKASLQAHPDALFTLAICLIKGYGTKCNKSKAIEFLRLAAERGSNDAVEILNKFSK